LTALAALAAVAVDRDRLASTAAERSEWFERMAHTDPLTGLANERTVGRILELELARAGRQGSEVSFAMFDVDDFQATNREGGNEAGDDVLRRVAAVLAESVRLVDTVGRIGGDEFVLVAPGSAGMTVAQRVLDGIAALPAVAGRPITVSAGVARFPVDGTDAASLISAAKGGLARARAEGRVGGTVVAGVTPES
jgi:diguanylate cyclase (GGDEF)-like protein